MSEERRVNCGERGCGHDGGHWNCERPKGHSGDHLAWSDWKNRMLYDKGRWPNNDMSGGYQDPAFNDYSTPPIGLPGPGVEPEIAADELAAWPPISEDWWRSVPTSRDYLVTAMIQVVVNARDAVEARIALAEQLQDIVATSDYSQDPMNGVLVVEVEDVSLDEDM